MERIAIYGKGGVGKSVVATSLSVCFAEKGLRVLHVGCDPKADSAVRLLNGEGNFQTVLQALAKEPHLASADRFLRTGRHGIVCCESGGPQPGVGCGGRGVARTLEFLDELEVITEANYDVIIFDVLGDVVCGGFAAPLRQGFAEKVLIVISEEPMALFAANNISRAVNTYQRNGVCLAGFVANHKAKEIKRPPLERFADRLSSRVVTFVPRDPMVQEAERQQRTIIEYAGESATAQSLRELADTLLAVDPAATAAPTPMTDDEFFEFMRE